MLSVYCDYCKWGLASTPLHYFILCVIGKCLWYCLHPSDPLSLRYELVWVSLHPSLPHSLVMYLFSMLPSLPPSPFLQYCMFFSFWMTHSREHGTMGVLCRRLTSHLHDMSRIRPAFTWVKVNGYWHSGRGFLKDVVCMWGFYTVTPGGKSLTARRELTSIIV